MKMYAQVVPLLSLSFFVSAIWWMVALSGVFPKDAPIGVSFDTVKSFILATEPPDPRRVFEGSLKGSLKGFLKGSRRVLVLIVFRQQP